MSKGGGGQAQRIVSSMVMPVMLGRKKPGSRALDFGPWLPPSLYRSSRGRRRQGRRLSGGTPLMNMCTSLDSNPKSFDECNYNSTEIPTSRGCET